MIDWLAGIVGEGAAPIVTYALIFLLILIGFLLLRMIWRSLRGGTFIRGGKNRKPRLSVVDATAVDNRRRLILVRRDNVEHLVLIGGMNDVVIEKDIRIDEQPAQQSVAVQSKTVAKPAVAKATQSPKPKTQEQKQSSEKTPIAAAGAVLGAATSNIVEKTSSTAESALQKAAETGSKITNPIAEKVKEEAPEISLQRNETPISTTPKEEPTTFVQNKPAAPIDKPTIDSHQVKPADSRTDIVLEDEMEELLNQLSAPNKS